MSGVDALSVEMHVYADSPRAVKTFDATSERGPFVVLQLGEATSRVALFVDDEDGLNALATMVAEARASLAAAVNRTKAADQAQPMLPELLASR